MTTSHSMRPLALMAMLALAACQDDDSANPVPVDSGAKDGTTDGPFSDVAKDGPSEGSAGEAGPPDGGTHDTSVPDSAIPDAATVDTGVDAHTNDAGDAGSESGSADAATD